MKFWPFGAALIFLSAILISACSSYLLDNMSRIKGKWMTLRPGRQRRPSGTKWERLYLNREKREKPCVKSKNGCCTKCPQGTFLNNCTCVTCDEDTYMDYENDLPSCKSCEACELDGQQVVVIDCAPEHQRKCGCERGYYKVNDHGTTSIYFNCRRCTDCAGSNKQTKKNCSEMEDTVCGDCLPKFHLQGKVCQIPVLTVPCGKFDLNTKIPDNGNCGRTGLICPAGLVPSCHQGFPNTWRGFSFSPRLIEQPPDFSNTVYLLLCLPCLLLLGASIAYCKRRCISGQSSPVDTLLAAAAGTASSPKHKSEEPTRIPLCTSPPQVQCGLLCADPSPQRSLLQGRKLYTIIDAVPVRRWKEFMRGLGLRDGEIEAVEVEYTQLREQQYEMLKRWCQQQSATVDAIFAMLEDMHLGGCAQELREQMQPSTLLPAL